MSECAEIARSFPTISHRITFTEALQTVRRRMMGETETVITNVAWSLYMRNKREHNV